MTVGAEYAQQGQNICFTADTVLGGTGKRVLKINAAYLRIPFTINYIIATRRNATLHVYSGISLGLRNKINDNYQDIIQESILLPVAEKRFKKHDWAVPIGINYKKGLGRNTFVHLGIEYTMGLTDAFEKTGAARFGVLSVFDNFRQNRLALNLGFGFSWGKSGK